MHVASLECKLADGMEEAVRAHRLAEISAPPSQHSAHPREDGTAGLQGEEEASWVRSAPKLAG